jgi:hypothetical protein
MQEFQSDLIVSGMILQEHVSIDIKRHIYLKGEYLGMVIVHADGSCVASPFNCPVGDILRKLTFPQSVLYLVHYQDIISAR